MKVRIAPSRKMPVLNSYYVSGFNSATLELLKSCKPFTTYHKDLQEYELTPDVYAMIKEPSGSIKDERPTHPVFVRHGKDKYGYQEDAVAFAMQTDNVFINFAQGMGKSLTTMKIVKARGFRKTLIVCGQSNLQEEWIKDARKHRMEGPLNFRIVGEMSGSNAKRESWLNEHKDDTGVDVINIEALRKDSIIDLLNMQHYDCIVVDEVQSAKGWKSEQTEGLHMLHRYAGQVRIALSGTPVLNNPLEFFSMLKYFEQLKDTARTTFEKYYGVWGFDYWGHYVCKGYRNLKELNELIEPLVCYVGKEELNLPGKIRKKVDLNWEVPERFMHLKSVYRMSAARLKKAGFSTKPEVRAEMQYLSSVAKPKLDFVLEHAKTSRLLVFSQYTTVLENYRENLAAKGCKVLFYHGQLSMKDRLEVLREWRENDYDVLLLSVNAARYGLNLTQAKEVVFLEPPTSLSVLEQCEDRSYRIGQDEVVKSYILCVSSIDQDALDNIEEKQRALDELASYRE